MRAEGRGSGPILTATTLASALGIGRAATLAALQARRSGLAACDFAGIAQGFVGRVAAIEDHALPAALARFECRNHRLADLALRADGFAEAVAGARGRYGAGRIAVVVGTSTSGILQSEEAYRARDPASGALPDWFDYTHTHDMGALGHFVAAALGLEGPCFVVSTACASSARAFADAERLIEAGFADAAVVGGADSLCRMTLRGFAALELISPFPSRPCAADRAGLSIGEAAGFALLERDGEGVALLGAGASSDGYHMSAPRPDGAGAAAAMRAALAAAGLEPGAIDYVNLHGTGTPANDAMEDAAMVSVFGAATPCSSTKGFTGHTLGAAGVAEALIAAWCIEAGLLPGCLGIDAPDPAFGALVLTANREAPLRRVLSNSFGFGGINCSLVLGRP
ncbi:MAG: beta-ketoacyl-ACP synthase [Rhodospirillales bacterium]|nr:beta-ketoacyl-ACP synthase [Rhodospirillales bacterium]